MLIREALNILQSIRLHGSSKVALLCSFEALQLKTYLQAYLAKEFPGETPAVVTFGYDQLAAGLAQTASSLKKHPVLLCLSWEDIHPALSWRGRGKRSFGVDDLAKEGERLKWTLRQWIESRHGAETYFVLPQLEFFPLLDPCPSSAIGIIALTASVIMWEVAQILSEGSGRLLKLPSSDLNYRDLLLSGCPYSAEFSESIARRFVEVACRKVQRKKALVTDLDGTLWQGIIGEEGFQGVFCKPEGRGYPFYIFQEFLLKLKEDGILLAFCSKNNSSDVLPTFDAMGMPLKLADFAVHRCNWEQKSENLVAIANELNIGLDALVFVDDDEVELAEVKRVVPAVTCFKTPRTGVDWKNLLYALQDLFATWHVGEEDRIRTQTFAVNQQRALAQAGTRAIICPTNRFAHLKDMGLEVTIQRHAFGDPRSLELINKTNQFNLTGERFSQEEWLTWSEVQGAFCLSARLKDRFGDFGTIGVITGKITEANTILIRQFVLSCRAFGRGVETILLGSVIEQTGLKCLAGLFKDTGKNEPAGRFLAGLGRAMMPDGSWRVEGAVVEDAYREILTESGMSVSLV